MAAKRRIVLYHSPASRAFTAYWMLEELGVPFDGCNVDIRKGEQKKPEYLKPGVIDHMPFSARGSKEKCAQHDAAGVHYARRKQIGSGTWQVFFFDPNGARVELDFDASEAAPDAHA